MSENRISFLYNIAACLPQSENNESLKLLRSFYLMRCKEITGAFGLPMKYFTKKTRCPHCCLEWNKKTDVKIEPIKLSTRQKQRIMKKKISKTNEYKVNARKALLQSNQMKQTCSFCRHTTMTTLPKPNKEYPKKGQTNNPDTKIQTIKIEAKKLTKEKLTDKSKSKSKTQNSKVEVRNSTKINTVTTNVYSNAFDVFSLKNKQNTLASTIKEPQKVIKNNKKKKDKFAGLCQKAVLASAKIKQETQQDKKQDKLSLFLKPSLG